MKAVTFHEHGGVEVLRYEEVPEPEIGPEDVLVEVNACALNHLDLFVRRGIPGLKLPLPHILGSDVAGVVAAVGERVETVEVGTRVVVNPGLNCGRCEFCLAGEESECVTYRILGEHVLGGYAERVGVPARNAILLPDHVSFEEAAAVPLVFMTAWRMLITRAKLRPGEDVLILGVGGGVASAALQIAKLYGAQVFATASSEAKLEKAHDLGADVLINYTQTDFDGEVWQLTDKRGVDLVVDSVGADTWAQSLRSLARGGRLVTYGATSGPIAETDIRYIFWRQLNIIGSTMGSQKELLEVLKLIWAGKLKPVIDRIYPLQEAARAHERLESRESFGKIVLKVGDRS
ncbi:MAG: zinc-binding dehydrogenase [Candidatus Bipolaricaulia bacterium]